MAFMQSTSIRLCQAVGSSQLIPVLSSGTKPLGNCKGELQDHDHLPLAPRLRHCPPTYSTHSNPSASHVLVGWPGRHSGQPRLSKMLLDFSWLAFQWSLRAYP